MTQPRISPVEDPTEEQRDLLAKTLVPSRPEPLNVFKTLVRHPHLMKRINALGGLFMAHPSVGARERELAILRVAWRTRSVYEFGQHQLLGAMAGVTTDEIRRIAKADLDDDWADADQVLLECTDELIAEHTLADRSWRALGQVQNWDDLQLVEFVALVGFYAMLAGVLNSAGVELDDSIPGWPDGAELD